MEIIKQIIQIVSKEMNISTDDIKSSSRKRNHVIARCYIAGICDELRQKNIKITYKSIGNELGKRDHTTIMHNIQTHKQDLSNYLYEKKYRQIRDYLFDIIDFNKLIISVKNVLILEYKNESEFIDKVNKHIDNNNLNINKIAQNEYK